MKNKLILLCGMSNSGKSTYCSSTIHSNPNTHVRVNRDKIREMLFSYTEKDIYNYYHRTDIRSLEEMVTEVENKLIKHFLNFGKNVIVDATHLKAKYLNRFHMFDCEKEILMFDISLEEAKERNSKRERRVDEAILFKQYDDYQNIKIFLTKNNLKFNYICIKGI